MCKDATQRTEQYVVVIECDDNKEFVFETEGSRGAGIEVFRTIRILVTFVDDSCMSKMQPSKKKNLRQNLSSTSQQTMGQGNGGERGRHVPKMQDNDQEANGIGNAMNNEECRRLKYTEKILVRICFE